MEESDRQAETDVGDYEFSQQRHLVPNSEQRNQIYLFEFGLHYVCSHLAE